MLARFPEAPAVPRAVVELRVPGAEAAFRALPDRGRFFLVLSPAQRPQEDERDERNEDEQE